MVYNLKKFLFMLFIVFLIFIFSNIVSAQGSAYADTIRIQFNGKTWDVNAVWIDLKDPVYRAEAALAKGRIGKVDTLENIALQLEDCETEIVAAINGTFFNAYSDFQPVGDIQIQGRNAFISNAGSSIGFTAGNLIEFDHTFTSIAGSINGNWEYPYNWSVWGINQIYSRADANILYTPDFGNSIDAGNKTAIVVRNKKVVDIRKGVSPIYSDGYTLVFGAKVYYSQFKIGDAVDYKIQYSRIDYQNGGAKGEPIKWSHMRTTLGAGPMLLQNGEIVLNAEREGYTDEKFLSSPANRSFIGEMEGNILVLGTVKEISLSDLAQILKSMNAVNAMNLDGGNSSGLFFNGISITSSSREIGNAIVITKKKTRPIRIELNGMEVFFDTDPYFENSTTMVPMRGIMEALGAEVGWDAATGTLWASKGDIRIEMWDKSDIVRINGFYSKLPAPVCVRNNRTHVPARFITEIFGGKVDYDQQNNMVVMAMEVTSPAVCYDRAVEAYNNGRIEEAERLFLEVIKMDESHAGAMLKLARYYASIGNHTGAKLYYEKFLVIQPDDYSVWNSLGWTYYSLGELTKSKEVFAKLTSKVPTAAAYWIALGDVYAHYQIKDKANALKCYEKALACNPSDSQKSTIQARVKKLQSV